MKTIVIEATTCPSCGKPMPAGPLGGLCPVCLLAQGAAAESGDGERGGRFVPPPLEEVAKLFPQLEILGLLGAGGMGAVYKARQPALDRIVALKVLPSHNAEGVNFAERFNREARALARLNHPNIVAVYEFGDAGGLHFFIMEFVDGANLRQLEQAGRLAPREALQIIPQICDALQYAHDEGVVHRDIKPENVLIDRKGRVKIADFGLAKILGQDLESLRLTAEGQVMGTPHYMAPEQIEKPLLVDHRADIYSLGVVFYEMLTGDLPLGKFSPPSRKVQIDVRLDEVVLRALENDPTRRYQRASEVKTQVENIAGTPAPATAVAPEPEQNYVRWAGFPLVQSQDTARAVNWPQVLFAVAVVFGVLTIAFGLVTLVTERSPMGWLGVVGWPSVVVRLALAAGVVAFGLWRAWRGEPEVEKTPQTPRGTVVLPPEKFSRKAIVGACWIPFALFAFFGMFVAHAVVPGTGHHGPSWWQIVLAVVTLPLGFTAPLGTTILGWMAVGDIRRQRGRLSGLPLAVFDGLFFPLLALDVFLYFGLVNSFYWFTATQMERPFQNPPRELVTFGVILVCALVDLLIVRRVWRAVRSNSTMLRGGGDWWWSRKRGALAIGLACAVLLLAVGLRREQPGIFGTAPEQVAVRDAATGALVAYLPLRGRMELLAISDSAAPGEWWQPNGRPHAGRFGISNPGSITSPNLREKDFIFRFVDLPQGSVAPVIECNPGSGSVATGQALRDGQPIDQGRAFRFAWPERVDRVTLRLGVSLVPWRTVSTYVPSTHATRTQRAAGDPDWIFNFHQAGESGGGTMLTVVRSKDDGQWQTQIVAVDTNGVEHGESSSNGTASANTATWTFAFKVPLAAVKEFRAKVRPLHWVEFRDVAVSGMGSTKSASAPPPSGVVIAVHDLARGRLVAELAPRGTMELLAVSDEDAAPNAWWSPQAEAIPDTLFEIINPENRGPVERVNRNLIVRRRNLPPGASVQGVEFVNGGGGSGGGEILRDGKAFAGSWLLTGSFAPGTTQGTLRLGFGLAPWKTVSIHDADGHRDSREAHPGLPSLPVQRHQISEANGEAQITMVIGYPRREWETRVIGLDAEGKEHSSVSAHGSDTPQDTVSVWSYKFFQLPLARVKDFRVQVRPVQWIEFRDIPLYPRDRAALGRSSQTMVPTTWSRAREVHVTDLFDFDTALSGAFPIAADGTRKYRGIERNPSWMRERGYDVEAGTNELRTPQLFITDLKGTDWDSLTVQQLDDKLRVYYGPPRLPSATKATLPVTHGFRTADGATGILQISRFDEGRAGVHLRYKLIARAHFE